MALNATSLPKKTFTQKLLRRCLHRVNREHAARFSAHSYDIRNVRLWMRPNGLPTDIVGLDLMGSLAGCFYDRPTDGFYPQLRTHSLTSVGFDDRCPKVVPAEQAVS
jgi:hypothetical protein